VVHHRHYDTVGAETECDLVSMCSCCHDNLEEGIRHGCWSRSEGHVDLKAGIEKWGGASSVPRKRPSRKDRERNKNIIRRLTMFVANGQWEESLVELKRVKEKLDSMTGNPPDDNGI